MSGYKIHLISDPVRGTSQLYSRLTWTSAFKQLLLFYASPLSLSFTYLKLFLYTQCIVCINTESVFYTQSAIHGPQWAVHVLY